MPIEFGDACGEERFGRALVDGGHGDERQRSPPSDSRALRRAGVTPYRGRLGVSSMFRRLVALLTGCRVARGALAVAGCNHTEPRPAARVLLAPRRRFGLVLRGWRGAV